MFQQDPSEKNVFDVFDLLFKGTDFEIEKHPKDLKKIYSEKEILTKNMIIEGIMSIQSGDNPRIVEHKLSVFIPPSMRSQSEEVEGE